MRVLRGHIVCREVRWKVSAEEFRKHNYGWARTEIIKALMKDMGIEVTDFGSAQVIPVDSDYWIVLRAE